MSEIYRPPLAVRRACAVFLTRERLVGAGPVLADWFEGSVERYFAPWIARNEPGWSWGLYGLPRNPSARLHSATYAPRALSGLLERVQTSEFWQFGLSLSAPDEQGTGVRTNVASL